MIVGLDKLKEGIREKQLRDFALAIVKYQNFKTSSAVKHINYNSSETTIKNYFGCGVSYIKSNGRVKHHNMPPRIFTFIDEYLAQHVQPLIPSEEDRRCEYKTIRRPRYEKKNAVPPVAKLDIVRQPLTEKYDMYGIKLPNGHIVPCKNEDYSAGYLAALRDSNIDITDYKTILLKVSEV